MPDILLLSIAVFAIAVLYSSVGHAGGSGYIAVMSLFSVAPAAIKPTALTLNILVASIATFQFWRMGYFSWQTFWPFVVLSVPLAFVGGYVNLPADVFEALVGAILLVAGVRIMLRPPAERASGGLPLIPALLWGGGIGLLAGLTGTGGGIFLTPLLLFMGWATARTAAAVSALFILLNSVAGLVGTVSGTQSYPGFAFALVGAAGAGGLIGSYMGSRRLNPILIKRFLAVVLLIAGLKLVLL